MNITPIIEEAIKHIDMARDTLKHCNGAEYGPELFAEQLLALDEARLILRDMGHGTKRALQRENERLTEEVRALSGGWHWSPREAELKVEGFQDGPFVVEVMGTSEGLRAYSDATGQLAWDLGARTLSFRAPGDDAFGPRKRIDVDGKHFLRSANGEWIVVWLDVSDAREPCTRKVWFERVGEQRA